MRAKTGDTEIEDDVILGMVTNATSVGGFKALDDSIVKMDDGLNELILVLEPPRSWQTITPLWAL